MDVHESTLRVAPYYSPTNFFADRKVDYAPIPPGGWVRPVPDVDCLQAPQAISTWTRQYRILVERDVSLMGFRSYVTASGEYFTDETILPYHDRSERVAKFARGLDEDSPSGTRLTETYLEFREPTSLRHIDEAVICLCSDEPTNYGSWIYRILPKLIDCPQDLPVFLGCDWNPWLRDLLRVVHGGIRAIHHAPRAAYRLSEAIIPSMRNRGLKLDRETVEFYHRVARRLPGQSSHEKIYLSRQGAARKNPTGRTLVNEQELIDVLDDRGFVSIEIESLPFTEQFKIVRDAKVIVCPGGSGLFNSVFSLRADLIVDLEPNKTWVSAHHNLLKSCGIHHSMIFGSQMVGGSPHAPWQVDINAVIRSLSG